MATTGASSGRINTKAQLEKQTAEGKKVQSTRQERLEMPSAKEVFAEIAEELQEAAEREAAVTAINLANTSHHSPSSPLAAGVKNSGEQDSEISEVDSCSKWRNDKGIGQRVTQIRKSSVTGKPLYKKSDDRMAIKDKLEKLRRRHLQLKIIVAKINESLAAFRSDPVKVSELKQERSQVMRQMQASAEDVTDLSARLDYLESRPRDEWDHRERVSESDVESDGGSVRKQKRGNSMKFHPDLLPSYHEGPTDDPDHWARAARAIAQQFDLAGPGLVSLLQSKIPEKLLDDMGCYSDEGDTVLDPEAWLLKFKRTCSRSDRTATYRRYFENMAQKESQTHRAWLNSLRTVFRRAYPGEDPAYDPQAMKKILTRFRLGMHPGPMRMVINCVTQVFYMNFDRHLTRDHEVVFEELIRICKDAEQLAYEDYHDKGIPLSGRNPKECKKCYKHQKNEPCILDGLLERGVAVTETGTCYGAAVGGCRDSSNSSRDEHYKQVDWTMTQCYNCNDFGHIARACPKPKNTPKPDGGKRKSKRHQFANKPKQPRDPEHVKSKPQQFANKYVKAEVNEPNQKGFPMTEDKEGLYRERIAQLTEALKKSNMEVPEASAAGKAHLNF
jgi:hypothetical protein